MNNDVRKLVAQISGQEGVEVVRGGKHLNVLKDGVLVTTLPLTPSDVRWRANAVSTLRKFGITPASKPKKQAAARYRELLPLEEIASRVAAIKPRVRFAEFIVNDLPTLHPGVRTYKNVRSAEVTLAYFEKSRSCKPWAHEMLDLALRAWDRVESQKTKAELVHQELPLGQLVAVDTKRTTVTVTIDVTNLISVLSQLGITVEIN